jgi:uncharacterized BrkB/YihY/UPF0761 family membrane protein
MMQILNAPWETYSTQRTRRITRRDIIRSALAVLVLLMLCAWLASTYIGHSPGPYGACYASNGREVPCEVVSPKR